jgi:hypothetical protein
MPARQVQTLTDGLRSAQAGRVLGLQTVLREARSAIAFITASRTPGSYRM